MKLGANFVHNNFKWVGNNNFDNYDNNKSKWHTCTHVFSLKIEATAATQLYTTCNSRSRSSIS